MIGAQMRRFMSDVLEMSEKTREFSVYFASAREAFNMVMAAVDGRSGSPGQYRDYKLRQIMGSQKSTNTTNDLAQDLCVS